ncbi:cytochrome P450 [Gongronella butleri]|nr:cytochrome P450 [Gongronella butleri]
MLTQYLYQFAERFDRKSVDQVQSALISKEGAIGIGVAVLLLAGSRYMQAAKIDRGCPQVPADGLWGSSTEEYRKDPKAFINKWQTRLGPVYGARLFGQYITVVSGSYVREVFLDDRFSFLEGFLRFFDTRLLTNGGRFEDLTADEVAGAIKKYLSPNLKHYTPRVIDHLKLGLHEQCGVVPNEGLELAHIFPVVQHAVARASASVFVGPDLAKNDMLIDSFKNMVMEVGMELQPKPWLEPYPSLMKFRMYLIGKTSTKVRRHRKQLAEALRPEVERRIKESADSNWDRPDDMLQNIMENFTPPPDMDLITYLVNWLTQLIFAALHTTSENSTVVLYRLMQNPGLWDELYREQNEVLEAAGYDASVGPEVFTREILNKFVKMDSVIRESARMRNDFINLPHNNVSKTTLTLSNGAVVLPGENVYVNLHWNHNDGDLDAVLKDAQKFKPMRYLNQEKNATKIGEDFLLFGLGKHACPGRWFAVQEIKTMIALLLREYTMEALDEITFPEKEGLAFPFGRVKLTPRKPQAA